MTPLRDAERASRLAALLANHKADAPSPTPGVTPAQEPGNPLWAYFLSNTAGPGLWKRTHYFDIYHRHLARFVGQPVHVVEIGVYSGGSLGMWRSYFGERCHVSGVDIDEKCATYTRPGISVHIGDQADRSFWKSFRERSAPVDVVIDDGGHEPEQQIVTLEELLPDMNLGGVYICEDVTGDANRFSRFAVELSEGIHKFMPVDDGKGQLTSTSTPLQNQLWSISIYPFVVVLEKPPRPFQAFLSMKRGSEWLPGFEEWPPAKPTQS